MPSDVRASRRSKNGTRLHDYRLCVEAPGMVCTTVTRAKDLDNLRRNLISTYHTDPNHAKVTVSVAQIDDAQIGGWRRLGDLTMIGMAEPSWTPIDKTEGIDVNVRTGKLMGAVR